jgi:hypothetical protein
MVTEFCRDVKLQLSGISCITCSRLSNILANILAAIFRLNALECEWKPCTGQAAGSEQDMMDLTGIVCCYPTGNEHAAEEKEVMKFSFQVQVVRRRGYERSF